MVHLLHTEGPFLFCILCGAGPGRGGPGGGAPKAEELLGIVRGRGGRGTVSRPVPPGT